MNLPECTYRRHLVQHLATLVSWPGVAARLLAVLPAALALVLLDLEPARPLLEAGYARRKGGRPPRDPVAMLRSFVLMSLLGVTSLTKWVAALRGRPELAVLSGFEPADAPGVGTFYAFAWRLVDGPYRRPCAHVRRPSRRLAGTRGRFRRNLRAEKARRKAQAELAMESEARVQAEVRRVLTDIDAPARQDFHGRLNEILFACGVVPSAEGGLLGDLTGLRVAGDSAPLESGAHRYGRALCTCKADGKGKCDCDRIYSDPTATWGWDSHREKFFLGFRLHALVAVASGIELPLHVAVTGAHAPDVITAVDAVAELFKLLRAHLPEARIRYGLFDAGYDATWFYRELLGLGTSPVIPLAQVAATPHDEDGLARDEHGTPLCPGGAAMWRHSFDKTVGKIVYGCPAKRPGRSHGKACIKVDVTRCPLGRLCEPDTKMGPMVRLSVDADPRLNPPIARDSETWRQIYNGRTASERHFSHGKGQAGLGTRPWRREWLYAVGALAHALGCHGRARVRHGGVAGLPGDVDGLLAWLGAPPPPEHLARAA